MKVIRNNIWGVLPVLCFSIFLSGCNSRNEAEYAEKEAQIFLSFSTTSAKINQDATNWEDRVDEVRMLVFSTNSGELIHNEMVDFPNGFNSNSRAVKLKPGLYDFYFIANETAYASEFGDALADVAGMTDFETDPRFSSIRYNPDFVPDGTAKSGRFLMSAVYKAITLNAGGSREVPLPLPLPTSKVELIRALAKVEIQFIKKTSGSTIPEGSITSVLLNHVAAQTTVPPFDGYYMGAVTDSDPAPLTGFDYSKDNMGTVVFYIPEFLNPDNPDTYTELEINNQKFPLLSDEQKTGIPDQRRTVPPLSDRSVIRNYHYKIYAKMNAGGEIQVQVQVEPWKTERHTYWFQEDFEFVLPPITPTDSSVIFPSDCGTVEVLKRDESLTYGNPYLTTGSGLQGAFNDTPDYGKKQMNYGEAPFYCEKKYGQEWRLISSCELLSYFSICDVAYRVWTSFTWESRNKGLTVYPMAVRKKAQVILELILDIDLSGSVYADETQNPWGADALSNSNLGGMYFSYYAPGDFTMTVDEFTTWPYDTPPPSGIEPWYPMTAAIQLKRPWDSNYISPNNRNNWDKILQHVFYRYDYSVNSRCVRLVNQEQL